MSPGQSVKQNKKSRTITFAEGDVLPVTIKRIGINGEGIGYYKRQIIFVPDALPGEQGLVRVSKVSHRYAEGEWVKRDADAPERVAPPCPVYQQCGGCSLQHINYTAQLKLKRDLVIESFQRYTSLRNPPVRSTIGMEHPWDYRNKAQLQLGRENGRLVAGLYEQSSHRLVDVSGCMVQHPRVNEMIQITRDVLEQLKIPEYNERRRTGVVRTIVARMGFETGTYQLTLVTATQHIPRLKELILELRYRLPDVASIMQNINPGRSPLIYGEETRLLWGDETIEEKLGSVRFSLSPRAFFQLNPEQTVKLYNLVREAAALTGRERVVDAYCGVGTIGLWLAPDAAEVRGMDVIPEAIGDAKRNAAKNGIDNVSYESGTAEELFPRWLAQGFQPDVIVVDPPRTGCGKDLLQAVAKAKPKRLLYVSCNPSTLAKDCDYLLKQGFNVEWIRPLDMFPQTSHVECIVLIKRAESRMK